MFFGLFGMIRFRSSFNSRETAMQNSYSTLVLTAIASTFLLASTTTAAASAEASAPPITQPDGIGYVATNGQHHVKHYNKGMYKDAVVPCHHPLMLLDGFYVGAQAGYDLYRTRVSSDAVFPAVVGLIAPSSISANPVVSSNGFVGGLFGGYGELWSDFYYTGIEVFVNGSTAKQAQTLTNAAADGSSVQFNTQITTDLSWGISVIPGLKYSDSSLIYGRVGYSQAKLRGQSSATYVEPGLSPVIFGYNRKQFVGGLSYGIGIETAIYRNVSLRSEYNHYGYNSFSDPSGTNYSASNSQLMVSLAYHFA
jgi:opacity protein-like surface antigen